VLAGAGAAGVALLAGCVGDDDSDDGETFEIGMVTPLTGTLADFGERNERGLEVALNDINDVGVDGGELDVQVEDSESVTEAAISSAQLLVEQETVPFLIGTSSSGASIAMHESVTRDANVVHMSNNSTGLGLSDFPDLLRTSPGGAAQASALASIISDDGYDEVAVTYVNDNFGESIADAFTDEFDGEVTLFQAHEREQATYSSLIAEMADTGSEAWLFISYQQGFATQVTEMFESGHDPQLYGGDSNRGDTVLENTPDGSIDGMKVVEPSADRSTDAFQTYADQFEDTHGQSPTAWSGFTYDAVVVAALSIVAADEFTGDALSEVVRDVTRGPGEEVGSYEAAYDILVDGGSVDDVNYNGVSGPLEIDENGDPSGALEVFEVQDNEYVSVDFITS